MKISGREIVGETLRTLSADLGQRVIPHLADPDALMTAKMIAELLAYLAMWSLDATEGESGPAASPPDVEPGALDLASDIPVDGAARGRLANALQHEIEHAGQRDARALDGAVAGDRALYAGEQARLAGLPTTADERLARVETALTADNAAALVAACLGAGHAVLSVARTAGGYSKDSFFLDVLPPAGDVEHLVIRRDLPFGPGETRVVEEYALLERLARRGLPIAEPLGCDPTGILGQPAMLSRRVPGRSGTAPWDTDPAQSRDICLALAEVLAKLHAIAPLEIGLTPASSDPREQLRAYVLEWRDRWRRNRVHASPTLAAAFAWLLDNIPIRIDRIAIVHGDVGFHNAIVDDGRLAALLDWEFAHLGDPTEDLGYCRPFIEPLIPWDDFLARYREAGGGDYRAENARFFEVWRGVRNAVCCAVSWRGFLSAAYPALKMAYQGIPLYRTFVLNTAERLKEEFQWSTPA